MRIESERVAELARKAPATAPSAIAAINPRTAHRGMVILELDLSAVPYFTPGAVEFRTSSEVSFSWTAGDMEYGLKIAVLNYLSKMGERVDGKVMK